MSLTNKVYIVTGGSSGIGKAIAIELIKAGAKVIITGRNQEKLNKVAVEINADPKHINVENDHEIDDLYNYVKTKYNQLDGLINNAGIADWSPIDELTRDRLKAVFEVNVYGAAMMAAGAAKIFKSQNYGDLVNIASTASVKGFKMGSIYAASKFALRGMSQCWQDELRPFNVRVIQINPSEVLTAFNTTDRVEKPLKDNKLRPQEIADVVIGALKMDRRGFIPELTVFATNPF
jgi:3-oxoacyl-[acyl-carrier protein] reductase